MLNDLIGQRERGRGEGRREQRKELVQVIICVADLNTPSVQFSALPAL